MSLKWENIKSNISRNASPVGLISAAPIISNQEVTGDDKDEWNKFIDWCQRKNYNPKSGSALREYVQISKERNYKK